MTDRPHIVVLDGYTTNPGDNPWAPLEALGSCKIHERTPPELTVERAHDARIVLTNKVGLDATTLRGLPALEYISVLATGYDKVDVVAAGALGIPVSNVPGYCAASVAQTAFGLIIELLLGVGTHDAAVKAGEWVHSPDHSFWKQPIVELNGLTLGIFGYGRNGHAVATVGAAFGMRVVVYSPRLPEFAGPVTVGFIGREQLFSQSDVIVLCCPLTPDTARLVDAGLLATMKRSAVLVNVARGGLVVEADLAEALRTGVIAGAGLDVIAQEPMRPDNPLLRAPHCVFTPHVAWASVAARRRLMAMSAENVASFLAGAPRHVVNAPWLTERAHQDPRPLAQTRATAGVGVGSDKRVRHD